MRQLFALVSLLAVLVTAAVGCSDASGVVRGADPLLATSAAADTGAPDMCASGSTWTTLYSCFFGPMGKASCATQAGCHGIATDMGAQASGFVCGASSHDCYIGMTVGSCDNAIPPCPIVPPGGATNPKTTGLYKNLHTMSGGTMPKMTPTGSMAAYTFSADEMQRIGAWITGGAPEN